MSEFLQPPEDPAEINEWFKLESLKELGRQLKTRKYPKYPNSRLTYNDGAERLYEGGRMHLPLGEWDCGNTPNLPTRSESAALVSSEYELDSHGRPLHPWIEEMLVPDIGVVTNRGFYRKWGVNKTGDAYTRRTDWKEPLVLVVERADTGQLALAGGFVDPGETGAEAAVREAGEEANFDIKAYNPKVTEYYRGPVADLRVTANAWPDDTAALVELDPELSHDLPVGYFQGDPEETKRVGWLPEDEIQGQMFGSHRFLAALGRQAARRKVM